MKKLSIIAMLIFLGINIFTGDATTNNELPVEYMHASWSHNYGTIEETSENSDLVALIKVDNIDKEYTDANGIYYTNYNVEILNSISKDDIGDNNITIVMTGVNNNAKHIEFEDDPLLEPNQEFLVFLDKNQDGTYKIIGGPSGRLSYDENNNTVTSLGVSNKKVKQANPYIALKIVNKNIDEVFATAKEHIK